MGNPLYFRTRQAASALAALSTVIVYKALPRHGLLDASATFLDRVLYHSVHDGANLLAKFMTSVF